MTVACDLCGGSRYLASDPALGRCICVTPEALREADDLMAEICEVLVLRDSEHVLSLVTDYVEAVDDTYSTITAGRLTTGDPKNLKDAVDQALDEVYDGAAVALSDYLVSIGLPAAPAGATGNPALDRLIAIIH